MKRLSFMMLALLTVVSIHAQREVYRSVSPEFTVYVPDNGSDGRCVVLVLGGGYNHVAKGHEGADWIPVSTWVWRRSSWVTNLLTLFLNLSV